MDNAVPVEVEEEATVPERQLTNVELVFGEAEDDSGAFPWCPWCRGRIVGMGHGPGQCEVRQ